MRNIKRIDRICKKLAKFWKTVPDQRFGQMLCNYVINTGHDIFLTEDTRASYWPKDWETWEEHLDKLLEGKNE